MHFVPQLCIPAEGNEDISDARMMKLGTKVLVALHVTVAVQTQPMGHKRYVPGANAGLNMLPSFAIPPVKSMPRIFLSIKISEIDVRGMPVSSADRCGK